MYNRAPRNVTYRAPQKDTRRIRQANRAMQGTRLCVHECNTSHGGCRGMNGSLQWKREGGSIRRHEKSWNKHPYCTTECVGRPWLPAKRPNSRRSTSAPSESAEDVNDYGGIDGDGMDDDGVDGAGSIEEEAMVLDQLHLTRTYNVLVVMDPSRLLPKVPRHQQYSEWSNVDVYGGQRLLDDHALRGLVFLDRSRRAKDLIPLQEGQIPLTLHEKVCLYNTVRPPVRQKIYLCTDPHDLALGE